MNFTNNINQELNISDIIYHLNEVKVAIYSLQLEYNRDKHIGLICDKTRERLNLIEEITEIKKLQLPIAISYNVNELFKKDKRLSMVNVKIINSKRILNKEAVAYLKITTRKKLKII